jgi:predicted phage baseplate assembly protein
MKDTGFACREDRRHEEVRHRSIGNSSINSVSNSPLYGLSYLEVGENQMVLKVYFIGKPPDEISKESLVIEGGTRIRDIQIDDQPIIKESGSESYLEINVNHPGDFSTYVLKVVELDEKGRPTDLPRKDFDPLYASLEFSFKAGCPSSLDCKPKDVISPSKLIEPDISYLAKDYASFRQLILDRMALILPEWKERHPPDLGMALVEILAYAGDHLSYYQDAVATEAYLDTARQRISVCRHVRLVDYRMHEGCNARTWVFVETDQDIANGSEDIYLRDVYFLTKLPPGHNLQGGIIEEDDLKSVPSGSYEVFQPLEDDDYSLRDGDIDLEGMVLRLIGDLEASNDDLTPRDKISAFLLRRLSETTKKLLKHFRLSGDSQEELCAALCADLNRIMQGSLYDSNLFSNLDLREETRKLADKSLSGTDLVHFNRLLLEDALEEISKKGTLRLFYAHNNINFYTWGCEECCLPIGATRATLRDEWLEVGKEEDVEVEAGEVEVEEVVIEAGEEARGSTRQYMKKPTEPQVSRPHTRRLRLRKGDYLLLEEVKGPRTGVEGDADPSKRHVVQLTKVIPSLDPVFNQPVVEVEWAKEDALPFSICISAVERPAGVPPRCQLLEGISVARGNLILADHGRSYREPLGTVEEKAKVRKCLAKYLPEDTTVEPDLFRPQIPRLPLTFSQPIQRNSSAAKMLMQNPREALPCLKLYAETGGTGDSDEAVEWLAVADPLESRRLDRHFMVEMDNDGRAHLRFGDGELGRRPEVGMKFKAVYRIGNGPAGNIGRDMISNIVLRNISLKGIALRPRNPLPAVGGTSAEEMENVKLFAPHAFRKDLQRAVTANDYARLAERHPGVQRAAAAIRWTGNWHEVMVAIDPLGAVEAGDELLLDIERYLFKYKSMGHDLVVKRASYVPLDIEMTICVQPDYLLGQVEAELKEVFSNRMLANGGLGFFHPDRLSFGEGIYLSRIVAVAQAVPGVESVIIDKFQRLFESPNQEIERGILPLSPMEIARLDNNPSFPENGKLVINLKGGR